MAMEFVRFDKRSEALRTVRQLYKRAFPSDERVPFRLLAKKADPKKADFWTLYNGDEFIGMAYVVKNKSLAYLYYFAVRDELRGKGYGTKIISELKARYSNCRMILALEQLDGNAPNAEQRQKRHDFYAKCGFTDLEYNIREATVTYAVMGIGGDVEPHEYNDMMLKYLGKFYYKILRLKMF